MQAGHAARHGAGSTGVDLHKTPSSAAKTSGSSCLLHFSLQSSAASWLLVTALQSRTRHSHPFSLLPSYSCPSWCASASNNQVVADGGTTKLHQRSATLGVRTAALKQNLQCHKSRWFGFLHPREFCTSCWQATTHGPVLNRSAQRRSARKGVVGFLAEPGTMPKAAKSLSCFLLAYFTSPQRQLSRTCLVGAFLSPELIPVPKVQSPERFS